MLWGKEGCCAPLVSCICLLVVVAQAPLRAYVSLCLFDFLLGLFIVCPPLEDGEENGLLITGSIDVARLKTVLVPVEVVGVDVEQIGRASCRERV